MFDNVSNISKNSFNYHVYPYKRNESAETQCKRNIVADKVSHLPVLEIILGVAGFGMFISGLILAAPDAATLDESALGTALMITSILPGGVAIATGCIEEYEHSKKLTVQERIQVIDQIIKDIKEEDLPNLEQYSDEEIISMKWQRLTKSQWKSLFEETIKDLKFTKHKLENPTTAKSSRIPVRKGSSLITKKGE